MSDNSIEMIKTFFYNFGQALIIIWNYICVFFSFIGEALSDWFYKTFPVLPPVSKFLGIKKLSLTMLIIILLYMIIANILAFHMYTSDKQKAKKHQERISEAKLLKIAFTGGALGSYIGMHFSKHKTRKKKFTVSVTVFLIIQSLVYSALIGFFGFWIYLS